MKSQASFKELRKHSSYVYSFEKHDIVSDHSKQFASNHWHDETEVVYVISGCINITINHKTFVGKPGDIFIVNSGELHEIYGIKTPLKYCAFVFDFDMLSSRRDDLAQQNFIEPILKEEIYFSNYPKRSKKAFSLLQYINEINTQKTICYMLSTKAALMQFFAILIEENQIFIAPDPALNQKKQLLKNIIAYINRNYTEKISLKEIADHFHMSRKYFCRFFKKNFNKTFIEYLNDVRIEHATYLLGKENFSVTEAAISCGFFNMSYFAHTFKEKMGCTPSQYKKMGGY